MSSDVKSGSIFDLVEDMSAAAEGIGNAANATPGISSAYQAFCRVAAATPGGQLAELLNIGTVCTPYLETDGRTFGSVIPNPFSGGQCPDQYNVGFTASWELNGVPDSASRDPSLAQLGGPLSVFNPTPDRTEVAPTDGGPGSVGVNWPEGSTNRQVNWIVNPAPGNPDNCGDGESYQPGDGWQGESYDEPQTITGDDGKDRNITVGPPVFDDNGGLSIPVQIDELNVDIGGGSADPGNPVGGPPQAESGDPIGGDGDEGEEDLPEPPEGKAYVALHVQVSGIDVSRDGAIPNTAPNQRTYAPLGNVTLRLAGEDSFEGYGEDIVLKNQSTVVSIPVEGLQIKGFRVKLIEGLSYTATPFLRPIPESEE